jgi:hypothetical protein
LGQHGKILGFSKRVRFGVPDTAYLQYGSFGLIVFVVVWFVKTGFPRIMDAVENSVTRVLSKIDAIEERCAAERESTIRSFREEIHAARMSFGEELRIMRACAKDESDADRMARHKTTEEFTKIIAQFYLKLGI